MPSATLKACCITCTCDGWHVGSTADVVGGSTVEAGTVTVVGAAGATLAAWLAGSCAGLAITAVDPSTSADATTPPASTRPVPTSSPLSPSAAGGH